MQADFALRANLEFNVKLAGEALFGQPPDWNKLRNLLTKNGLATGVIDQHRDEITKLFAADQAERCASSLKAQPSAKPTTSSSSKIQPNDPETSQGQASRAIIADVSFSVLSTALTFITHMLVGASPDDVDLDWS
jgi:hypothetical protein